jgi:integrase
MSANHSITVSKPAKPYVDFPLFPHATGRWAKKIRGKLHYFGPWDDPDGALAKYLEQKDDLHAGREPRRDQEAVTVKDVANAFLNAKKESVKLGELSSRTWDDYKTASDLAVKKFGKRRLVSNLGPEDFAGLRSRMAHKWGPHRLAKCVQYVRSMFKFALDSDLIPKPVRFGPGFKGPSKKTLRIHRMKQGPKLFTVEEIRKLLADASVPLKAMILLGLNAGFGNADCATLPLSALDLEAGWVNYPRPKTGIPRRCPLWRETVEALKEVRLNRPIAKKAEHAGLVFITKYGDSWGKDTSDNPIAKEMRKLLHALGINGRKGLGFYTLRHVFRTIADESKDQPAVDHIMGHESPHMSSVYREGISDERLRAVVEHVRRWLFPADEKVAVIPFAKRAGSA